MWKVDLFYIYRDSLTVFVSLYYALTITAGAWQVARVLRGNDARRRMLRMYLSYQFLTIRVRPLAGELLQILAWLLILIGVWRLHFPGK